MFAASADRKMNRTLASFQKQRRPEGASVRTMTEHERKVYLHKLQEQRYSTADLVRRGDNRGSDLDLALGRIHNEERSLDSYLDRHIQVVKSFRAQYDASRISWVVDRSESRLSLNSEKYQSSQRTVSAGKYGTGHFYGLEMQRSNLGMKIVQYDLDLNKPQNSVIFETSYSNRQS